MTSKIAQNGVRPPSQSDRFFNALAGIVIKKKLSKCRIKSECDDLYFLVAKISNASPDERKKMREILSKK